MAKPRILVVDDEQNVRKTLEVILSAKGYEVLTAGDGADGLAYFRKGTINLALIDLGLPDMSGIDVLKSIKRESPSTQAIILTGGATLESAIDATNRGAFSYLRKPYEMDQLLINIRRAIEKQRSEEEIVRTAEELRKSNAELQALYNIATVITKTHDLERLFPDVLASLSSMDIFGIERRGAIFLAEEGRLRLAASLGLPDGLCERCGSIGVGECLCGRAVRSGDILISSNSADDENHTISCQGMPPHGHVIVPMKSGPVITGVLCLYTGAGVMIEDSLLNPLRSVGSQLGLATEKARLYEKTKELSFRDPLTGLGNRRLLEVMLRKSLAQATRFSKPLSLMMTDIDYFKQFNDAYGHVEGDKILSGVARILTETIRGGDLAIRYGGEEFLVLLYQTDLGGALSAAERIRAAVEREMPVTISIGVAAFSGRLKREDQLVSDADEALYRAKQKGRNRVEPYG